MRDGATHSGCSRSGRCAGSAAHLAALGVHRSVTSLCRGRRRVAAAGEGLGPASMLARSRGDHQADAAARPLSEVGAIAGSACAVFQAGVHAAHQHAVGRRVKPRSSGASRWVSAVVMPAMVAAGRAANALRCSIERRLGFADLRPGDRPPPARYNFQLKVAGGKHADVLIGAEQVAGRPRAPAESALFTSSVPRRRTRRDGPAEGLALLLLHPKPKRHAELAQPGETFEPSWKPES